MKLKDYQIFLLKFKRKLVQLRNIETTGLKRSDLIYMLIRSQSSIKKQSIWVIYKLILINEIKSKTNEIRKLTIELGMMINKSDRDIITKRLEEIDHKRPKSRQRRRILEELTKIFNDLQFKRKHINSAFDSSSYYYLKDLEYSFGDLVDYYKPILAKDSSDGNYQMYSCRGDKDKTMYITEYLDKIRSYLFALIDEKENSSSQKIQLVISINLIHLTKSGRITFYVKSKNIVSHPSDKSEDILYQLYDSLLKYFNDKLMICRADSSYVFESIEVFDKYFHKIDLKRGSSYIPSPTWLQFRKAIVNPKYKNDNYCFAYAITIAIYHNEIGKNLNRISNKL